MDSPDLLPAAIEPVVTHRECGGWLAVAPKWSPLRIGVTAGSEAAARKNFKEAVTAWSATLASV